MLTSHYIYFRLGARSLAEETSAGSHRFFEDKATEHLLGQGILPEYLKKQLKLETTIVGDSALSSKDN